jgi:hypothetical protein
MRPRYLRGLVVGIATGAIAVSATNAIAGTGIGAVFNLGKTNTVNHATVLQGSTTTRLLQVTNTGPGPALALTVKTGTAPMKVSSGTKVAHLNADMVDGLDSTQFRKVSDPVDAATLGGQAPASFVQTDAGVVQKVLRGRLTEPLNSGNAALLPVAGFGSIEASCGAGGIASYRLFWRNSSGGVADVWFADSSTGTTYLSPANGGGTYVAPVDTSVDRIVTVTVGLPGGSVATVTVSAHASAGGCVFLAQAVAG